MGWLTRQCQRILGYCLTHRVWVLIIAVGVFILSLTLAGVIKKEFVPSQDQGNFLVRIQTPIGSALGFADNAMKQAEAFMSQRPEVSNYYAAIGGFGGGEVNTGIIFVTLKPRNQRHLGQNDMIQVVRKELNKIPGVERAIVQDLSLSGFSASRGFPVEFTLRGPDWGTLASLSEDLRKKMSSTGKMVDVDSDYKLGQPEVRVIPNRTKAAAHGVNISSIGNAVNATIGGIRVGKFTRGGKRYDVRVRLVDKDRGRPQDIDKIWVRNDQGQVIPLSEVVSMRTEATLLSITRKNREQAISLLANMAPGGSQQEALQAVQQITKDLPAGYRAVLSGSAQTFKESGQSLMIALILGIFVAYMVLGAQFNSFIHPVTVLMALPFSVTGAFMALWLSHKSLNIYSMIGIILLMGIVKKNSILLVDFTNERRKLGENVHDALMNACPFRLRPILMTSVATIAGAIPPAPGLGPGAGTRIPIAIVVLGGVLVSTLLTLFVVPSVYSLLSRFESHAHDAELKETLIELGELNSTP